MASQDWFDKDFYKVLGVPKDISAAELKKAYRKLARKYHPDSNPGDAAAEAKFKEISEAHAVLSDPEQRKEYDQMRAMGAGAPRFTAGGGVATSITANGLYSFNPGGLTRFRVHITTLTGGSHTVTVGAAGTAAPNAVYLMNPQAVSGPVGIVDAGGVNQLAVSAGGAASVALVAGSAVVGTVGQASDYPAGATPLTASATGTTAATTATLAGTSGKTTYLCGYSIMTSATAATVVAPTVTGVITGTLTMSQYVPANTAGVNELKREFAHCVPASGTNQAIAVVSGAAGSGGVTAVNAWGYQL